MPTRARTRLGRAGAGEGGLACPPSSDFVAFLSAAETLPAFLECYLPHHRQADRESVPTEEDNVEIRRLEEEETDISTVPYLPTSPAKTAQGAYKAMQNSSDKRGGGQQHINAFIKKD